MTPTIEELTATTDIQQFYFNLCYLYVAYLHMGLLIYFIIQIFRLKIKSFKCMAVVLVLLSIVPCMWSYLWEFIMTLTGAIYFSFITFVLTLDKAPSDSRLVCKALRCHG